MKKFFFLILFFVFAYLCNAQTQDVATLQQTAKTLMQQADYDNALEVLDRALELEPNNLEVLKDKAFANYLKRNFAAAIETGKFITDREDADVQSFQILGLAYKAIAEYKEADKMYKTALKKFPNSGLLYSEYGEMLASNKNEKEAIAQWEKGIETDPNNSSNYYYAAKYYADNNLIWSLLYGEIFVNIESLTKRTNEIKTVVFNDYKNLLSNPDILAAAKREGSAFEKEFARLMSKYSSMVTDELTTELLTEIRARFILDWYFKNSLRFPFRLFKHHQFLLQEGYFDAYNQWVFGATADTQKLRDWMNAHADEVKTFQQFQSSFLFKIPEGQYYPH